MIVDNSPNAVKNVARLNEALLRVETIARALYTNYLRYIAAKYPESDADQFTWETDTQETRDLWMEQAEIAVEMLK